MMERRVFVGLIACCLTLSSNALLSAPVRTTTQTPESVLSFARADMRNGRQSDEKNEPDLWKKAAYIQVTLGNRDYIYNQAGTLMKVRPAEYPSAGILGTYAEVGWDLLDRNMKRYCDLYGYIVLHFEGSCWQIAARNRGIGYDKAYLKIARVPPRIVKRLKLG